MPMPDLEPFARCSRSCPQHAQLWQSMLQRKPGEAAEPLVKPEPGDRRFSARNGPITRSSGLSAPGLPAQPAFLTKVAETAPMEEGPNKTRMQFVTRLLVEAMAPSNFAATNPEFIRRRSRPRARASPTASEHAGGSAEGPYLDDRRGGVRDRHEHRDDARLGHFMKTN